jgi:hypothetical protein
VLTVQWGVVKLCSVYIRRQMIVSYWSDPADPAVHRCTPRVRLRRMSIITGGVAGSPKRKKIEEARLSNRRTLGFYKIGSETAASAGFPDPAE